MQVVGGKTFLIDQLSVMGHGKLSGSVCTHIVTPAREKGGTHDVVCGLDRLFQLSGSQFQLYNDLGEMPCEVSTSSRKRREFEVSFYLNECSKNCP